MADLDWSNPIPSDIRYLKDLYLGYLERIIAYSYYTGDTTAYNTYKASSVSLPFSISEKNQLNLLLRSDLVEGSPALITTCVNILLKYMTLGNGLTGYYNIDPDNPPAANWYQVRESHWVWTVPNIGDLDWSQQPGYENIYKGNTGCSVQYTTMSDVAKRAKWVCNQIVNPIMLDTDTTKEIWLSMYRALQCPGYLKASVGGSNTDSNGNITYIGPSYAGYYYVLTASWLHAKESCWPLDVGVHSMDDYEYFTSVGDAWSYAKEVWNIGWDENDPANYFAKANYYNYGGVGGGAGYSDMPQQQIQGTIDHEAYTWTEPTGWDDDGNPTGWQTYSYDAGTFYEAQGQTYEANWYAYFPYTPDPTAVVDLPAPGSLIYLLPPAYQYDTTGDDDSLNATTHTSPPSGDIEAWGAWAGIPSADHWAIIKAVDGIKFNELKKVEHFGDNTNFSILPDCTPDIPASGTVTRTKSWQVMKTGSFFILPDFKHCVAATT